MKGFTLIEVLTYLAVLSMIIFAVSGFLVWASKSNAKNRAMRESLDSARRAVEIMTSEIREADGIYGPTTTSTQLSLETKKYLPSGEKTTYIDFYLCENRLCLKKESQSPTVITSDRVEVKNLEFTPINTASTTPSVQINFKVEYIAPVSRPEYQASFDATFTSSLRAY